MPSKGSDQSGRWQPAATGNAGGSDERVWVPALRQLGIDMPEEEVHKLAALANQVSWQLHELGIALNGRPGAVEFLNQLIPTEITLSSGPSHDHEASDSAGALPGIPEPPPKKSSLKKKSSRNSEPPCRADSDEREPPSPTKSALKKGGRKMRASEEGSEGTSSIRKEEEIEIVSPSKPKNSSIRQEEEIEHVSPSKPKSALKKGKYSLEGTPAITHAETAPALPSSSSMKKRDSEEDKPKKKEREVPLELPPIQTKKNSREPSPNPLEAESKKTESKDAPEDSAFKPAKSDSEKLRNSRKSVQLDRSFTIKPDDSKLDDAPDKPKMARSKTLVLGRDESKDKDGTDVSGARASTHKKEDALTQAMLRLERGSVLENEPGPIKKETELDKDIDDSPKKGDEEDEVAVRASLLTSKGARRQSLLNKEKEAQTQPDHPLAELLTQKRVDTQAVTELLDDLKGDAEKVDLEGLLSPKKGLPAPLFYAVGIRSPGLVALLIEYQADVRKRFPGPRMWNGIRVGMTAMEATVDRKLHFKGTVLQDRYEAIEDALKAEEDRLRGWNRGRRATRTMAWQVNQDVKSGGMSVKLGASRASLTGPDSLGNSAARGFGRMQSRPSLAAVAQSPASSKEANDHDNGATANATTDAPVETDGATGSPSASKDQAKYTSTTSTEGTGSREATADAPAETDGGTGSRSSSKDRAKYTSTTSKSGSEGTGSRSPSKDRASGSKERGSVIVQHYERSSTCQLGPVVSTRASLLHSTTKELNFNLSEQDQATLNGEGDDDDQEEYFLLDDVLVDQEEEELLEKQAEEERKLLTDEDLKDPGVLITNKSLYTATATIVCEHIEAHPSAQYEFKEKLGEGTFGVVRIGAHKDTGILRAIKSVPKMLLDESGLWQEIEVMRMIDHPNIMRLFTTFEDSQNVYMVTDYCAGGELFDALVKTDNGFSEEIAAQIVKQMLSAVCYLHNQKICHRDLKPENFLLTHRDDLQNSLVKLIDFGTAKRFWEGEELKTKICTLHYVAPEILSKKETPYTEKCDVWSLGVVIYLMLCGVPPFNGENDVDILKRIKKGRYKLEPEEHWAEISDDAKDLISHMIVVDPQKRYSADQAVKHPWVIGECADGTASAAMKRHDLGMQVFNKLRAFLVQNRLKKVAMQIIAQHLSDQEISSLRLMFLQLDSENKGTLQVSMMEDTILKAADCTEESKMELRQILSEFVSTNQENESETVNYTQFLAATLDRKQYLQEKACRVAFNIFDVDGNGQITKEELALVLTGEVTLGPDVQISLHDAIGIEMAEIERIVAEVDQDGDGEINFQEFMDMMCGQGTPFSAVAGDGEGSKSLAEGRKEAKSLQENLEALSDDEGSKEGSKDGSKAGSRTTSKDVRPEEQLSPSTEEQPQALDTKEELKITEPPPADRDLS